MSKGNGILRYQTAMALFRGWCSIGAISEEELSRIDAIVAEKHGLSLFSIYRENALLYKENRAIMA